MDLLFKFRAFFISRFHPKLSLCEALGAFCFYFFSYPFSDAKRKRLKIKEQHLYYQAERVELSALPYSARTMEAAFRQGFI